MNTRNKHSKWTRERNERIYRRYMAGETAFQIAQELHMASDYVARIILEEKRFGQEVKE